MTLHENAAMALQMALDKGAQQTRVCASNNVSDTYSVRDNALDRLQQAGESSLFIHLYVDGCYGTCSTNNTQPDALARLLERAVASTRLLAADSDRCLPDPSLCYRMGCCPDLHLFDTTIDRLLPAQKKELAFACAAQVYGCHERVLSVTVDYADYRIEQCLLDSQGLDCHARGTFFSLTAECAVQGKGTARPSDWGASGGLRLAQLTPACGADALQRALAKINPRKVRSGHYDMVVENRVSAQLLGPLLQALDGSALQQNNSFLKDKIGQQVFSPLFTLLDNPHAPGMMGARAFDAEGLATKPRLIVDSGVVTTPFVSTYYGRKLQRPVTVDGPSVLQLSGPVVQEATAMTLAARLKKGILVTGFNGGNCNGATGDFSYGVEGFLIKDGALAHPISEMVLSGNMLDLWTRLSAAGNDPLDWSACQIPALLFEHVSFAGL